MKILFLGTPDFAVASLRALVEGGYDVVGVVTMPDKPAGRGLHMQQSAVKEYALSVGLTVLQPVKLKDPSFLHEIEALKPDLGVVIAFRMLPREVWAMPRLGTLNLHGSLLPQYRGAAPINRAIINGETVTGVTTFLLNEEIDKGAILGVSEVPIEPSDTAGTLHDRLMVVGADLVLRTVAALDAGTAQPIEQPASDEGLHPAPKIFREDCRIDWRLGVAKIRNHIRGLSPYPAAWSTLGNQTVKIFYAEEVPAIACDTASDAADTTPIPAPGTSSLPAPGASNATPMPAPGTSPLPAPDTIRTDSSSLPTSGTIRTDGRTFLHAACGDGWLAVTDLQLAGKRRMPIADMLRGFTIPENTKFE